MSRQASGTTSWTAPLLVSILFLALFWTWGLVAFDGFELGLGSPMLPTPRHGRVLLLWLLTGTPAALALAVALERRGTVRGSLAPALTDPRFVVYASLLAGLIPALLRQWVLRDASVTDDEGVYRLAAQLLASGHLSMPSPPNKEFFDNLFLVNDGRLYTQYFLGWPALMVPGLLLGLVGWVNCLFSALTVVPLFRIVRRAAGSAAARLVTLCYLTSPMLMVCAATALSHTSCLALLAWLYWVTLRATGPGRSRPGLWVAAAALFSAAFFVRPLTALAIGAPLLVVLGAAWVRAPGRRLRLATAFVVPALLAASGFLWINRVQNGHPLKTAYARAVEYAVDNGLRFSAFEGHPELVPKGIPNLRSAPVGEALEVQAAALVRLDFALYGWPVSLLFAFLAVRHRPWLPLAMLGSFLAFHFTIEFPGIDLFGPVHYLETALPLLVLTGLGIRGLDGLRTDRSGWRALPSSTATVLAFVLCSLLGYTAVRLHALHRIASASRAPLDAADDAGLDDALVFVRRPWISYRCLTHPSRGWVYGRPDNSPDLADPVLWVNDLGIERDRAFAADSFPERNAFLMTWADGCRPLFLPLDRIRGTPED